MIPTFVAWSSNRNGAIISCKVICGDEFNLRTYETETTRHSDISFIILRSLAYTLHYTNQLKKQLQQVLNEFL